MHLSSSPLPIVVHSIWWSSSPPWLRHRIHQLSCPCFALLLWSNASRLRVCHPCICRTLFYYRLFVVLFFAVSSFVTCYVHVYMQYVQRQIITLVDIYHASNSLIHKEFSPIDMMFACACHRAGIEPLKAKVQQCRPLIVCFNGVGIFRKFARIPDRQV